MDHRPDTAQDTPPAEQAIMLRDKAPELYDLWLKIAQEKAATSNYVQRAPYEVPERLAQSGRPRALSAMIVVLAFCGYLASLGGPGPYIGGLIAILDLLVMLALFFGLRPDHLTDSGRPRKRRLIQAAGAQPYPAPRGRRPGAQGDPAERPGGVEPRTERPRVHRPRSPRCSPLRSPRRRSRIGVVDVGTPVEIEITVLEEIILASRLSASLVSPRFRSLTLTGRGPAGTHVMSENWHSVARTLTLSLGQAPPPSGVAFWQPPEVALPGALSDLPAGLRTATHGWAVSGSEGWPSGQLVV